jgi:thiol-disulfide isomerase/thioredoxin
MLSNARVLSFAILFLLGAGLSATLSGCNKEKAMGQPPELSLKTYAGETYTFGPDDGKVTLVVFWATWCVPCIEEIPQLKNFHKTYAEQGFRVVSINIDDPTGENAPLMARQFEINYPVLIGNEETEKAFGGLRALPTSILVGRDGKVKKRLEGLYPAEMVEALITAQLQE